MTNEEILQNTCKSRLTELGIDDEIYNQRLKEELTEIKAQDMHEYFLNLRGTKLSNDNNILVPYLLGICETFDINKPPKYDYGDLPDIDIDYIPQIRSYLKEKYTREQYGDDFVCNIATYTTFGLRSSLIDMAKVFDLDRKEILALTTRLGIKDDEGEILTWDKALELYDELREYLTKNEDMADAAKHMLHRNRNMGMHASGLIISKIPIREFVPLVKIRNNTGSCSSWVEGLHGTDLGAVGLAKMDYLSLDAISKIATATKRLGKVCALPGKENWSDDNYLNDEKCLKMATSGDLKMIFQYDGSEGIRRLAKQGGVSSFEDLAAYTALYRPACLKYGMHTTYCNRKNGKEKYTIHPKLSFLEKTYGVYVYQEDIMKLLNIVGKVPLKDCEAVRKAISKKKISQFLKYKEMFIKNGQEVLNQSKEEIEALWDQVEAFAGYGFGRAHTISYGTISARMLYLKAHHPVDFYSSVLSHTKAAGPIDYQKLRDYKQHAEKHGVKVNKVDINKSGADCRIVDNQIYYGMSKIRGIGEDSAIRIEQLQPFANYEDFLKKVGTEAKINQALIALRVFEGDPITLYQFYETYKASEKKKHERNKRFNKSIEKYREQLKELTGTDRVDSSIYEDYDENQLKRAYAIIKRITTATVNYENKNAEPPTLGNFEIDPDYHKLLLDKEAAEQEFYGFIWNHPLESCANYEHHTFEEFDTSQVSVGPIDVQIKKVSEKQGPKAKYYSLDIEDANCSTRKLTIWKDDYERFKEYLVKGNFIRFSVQAPTGSFRNFTLASLPRYKKPPKEFDKRVFPLN